MEKDVKEVLVSETNIKKLVAQLGQRITSDYEGKEIMVICILKGAVMFCADLIREIKVPLKLDFMAVSSYGESTESSGAVQILKDLDSSVEGRHLLIVEDIVDTGLTLRYLISILNARGPASIKTCAFLDKPERRKVDVKIDYSGIEIPDAFVIGYGLDYAEDYRHLPYVAVLSSEVYEK
ncbi:hypoxanthine phosphoribosyltransferase [Desulfitibacter alkalitolerans]|uniref:hypoxanthine phosphoribosyltransferase n=1 Tax=Desulfitibacter alkalitolerans TaxID=264641 RepID=UPI0004894576|nr:hypoxanthine phosphoribosyltransferase [Desulfitibacter alkalitolerans]